jgi:site-specific recombinase XerD
MNIEIAIQDFLEVHRIGNDSPYTIRDYRNSLNRFAVWLQSEHGVTDTDALQLAHLRGWVSHLQKSPSRRGGTLSGVTIRQYSLNLLIFCHWLEQEGVIEKPITTRFKLPRVEQKFVPTFTPDEVGKLLAACEENDRRKPRLCKALAARNRAIVTVLIDAGLRRQELAGLRLCDIDRDLRLLSVHRKGNKWQQVPVSRDGFKPLHEYLTKHRPYLAKLGGATVARKEDAVFLADDGKPLTASGISKLFERLQEQTGIEGKRVSAHNCRRYMATTQLAMGRSPFDVQRQMGHTSLLMTNRYASLTTQQLQRSHEEYSPLRAKDVVDRKETSNGYWDE